MKSNHWKQFANQTRDIGTIQVKEVVIFSPDKDKPKGKQFSFSKRNENLDLQPPTLHLSFLGTFVGGVQLQK